MGLESANSGNYVAVNYGRNPAVNFNFMLRVEAVFDLPCKSVRVFQKENEYELIQEGGLNDYVHMRRKPISKPFTFQVERYVGVDLFDPLANGTELVLPVLLMVNRYLAYGEFLPTRCYAFTGCTVMSKEYGELNAEKSGLMVETTTIAYREMFCIDNPVAVYGKEQTWEFSKDGNVYGNDKRNAITIDKYTNGTKSESRKADMVSQSKKWKISESDFKGTGGITTESDHAKNEIRKADMEKKAKQWEFAEGKFQGTGGNTTNSAYAQNEVRKADMEKNAKQWEFAEGKFQGTDGSTTNSIYAQNEVRKADMEKNAKQWEFAEGKFQGTDGSTTDSIYAQNEMRKTDMEDAAMKWEMSQYSFKGRNGSTTYSDAAKSEMRKAAMTSKAVKWPAKKSAVDVATFLSKK